MLFATFYSQEEHNLTICALWLPDLCHNLICVAHFFLNHHHLYYTNVLGRCHIACPCWSKVLQNSSNLCLQAWFGRALGSFTRHFMGGRARMKCVRVMSFWHRYFQRPLSVSSKKQRNPRRIPTASFLLEKPTPIVPQLCQKAINRTFGKLGAIVHTFYCPTINRNCEEQCHEQTHKQMKSGPGHKAQGACLGPGLDYLEKTTTGFCCNCDWLTEVI